MVLEGKTIAVIGGNGLIGKEAISAIVRQGGTVVSGSRSGEIESFLKNKVSDQELKKIETTTVDVNNPESVEKFFKEIL